MVFEVNHISSSLMEVSALIWFNRIAFARHLCAFSARIQGEQNLLFFRGNPIIFTKEFIIRNETTL